MIPLANSIRSALSLVAVSTVLLGGAYSIAVTGLAQALFPHKASGSLIERGGQVVGSEMLAQAWQHPRYFWPRPSALETPYNAAISGGSNLSPNNPKLREATDARVLALKKADPRNENRIPIDLVTASGSGLDPHISRLSAEYQLPRVARARGVKEEAVAELLEKHTTPGFLGLSQAYVNTTMLNLALDEMNHKKKR